jgi:site-specific recombinase XerD
MIRDAFVGVKENKHMLLEVFEQHNKDMESLIGKTIAQCTFNRYERTRKRLADFMLHRYKISDIAIKNIDYSFITDFENYLRIASNNGNNATAKFMQQFKRIVIRAKNNGWIQADPFVNYSIRLEKVDRGYLTEQELSLIMKKKFGIQRLEHVRDIFIFSCFTGLSYVDVYNLKENDIQVSFDDRLWIKKKRQKTNIQSNILLLDIPKIILNKYNGKLLNGKVLPVLSNQKVNSYLKEIGDLCGIKKNLTFHLARHTFATTITLSKGVPIETISKMLGHNSIKTTQIYARITDNKISLDMHELSEKLQGMDKILTI